MNEYIMNKKKGFFDNLLAMVSGKASRNLGHATVATWPDRPYLHWRCTFTRPRPENGSAISDRDNPATFFEACERLHDFFSRFAKQHYANSTARAFTEIAAQVREILDFQGKEDERMKCWRTSGLADGMPEYHPQDWEKEKNVFIKLKDSSLGIQSHVYKFHQAAAYHRYYVLKDLLPAHGIAVY